MNQLPVKKFSTSERLRSFVFAFAGIRYFFRREHNAWIHGVAAVLVLLTAFLMHVPPWEMIALLFCIALVLISEIFNTTIERTMDHLSPARHPEVKVIKDLAAASVLIAAFISLVTGLIIFIPKFL